MSKSILITGIFRNGKTVCAGVHEPKNDVTLGDVHFDELADKIHDYIYPKHDKIVRYRISIQVYDTNNVFCITTEEISYNVIIWNMEKYIKIANI